MRLKEVHITEILLVIGLGLTAEATSLRRPDLHEDSVYKMPGGVPMCWGVLTFFAISLVILASDPTTRIAVLITPIWFVFIASMYFVYRHRTQRKEGLR